MRRGTLTLLLLLVPVLPACGKLKCEDVAIDTPTDTFRTESASPGSFPRAIRGPVDQVLCCVGSHCANPPSCACGVDCTQPPLRDGTILGLSDSIVSYEGYPQLSNEYGICEVWDYGGRVSAVWWSDMY